MIDEIRILGHVLLDVFRVTFAVLRAFDMRLRRTCKIVVERDDRMSVRKQPFDEIGTDKSRAAGHQDRLFPHSDTAYTLYGVSSMISPCRSLPSNSRT